MNDIRWLDGKGSEGNFVLEIMFRDGGKGYMKNESYLKISDCYDLLWRVNPEIVGMTLYDPQGKPVATKTRMGMAA
jgi:hypothetical protein